ncbi:hypothetical protein OIDMADRAFT_48570 [Oidiodendron maius Zn]|uniref:Uncharacterized protein n=1 Tax=Oidiodendron maius (strain Zn) TaxID=913774 RepID=A0A0C3DBL0_OIDMZ|nr:hypothetical protein OIDMADRAFT_48570 [Oidiodendron maius Zn]
MASESSSTRAINGSVKSSIKSKGLPPNTKSKKGSSTTKSTLEHSTYAIERFLTGRTGSNLEYKHFNVSESIQSHTSRMSEQLNRFDAVFYRK